MISILSSRLVTSIVVVVVVVAGVVVEEEISTVGINSSNYYNKYHH